MKFTDVEEGKKYDNNGSIVEVLLLMPLMYNTMICAVENGIRTGYTENVASEVEAVRNWKEVE